MKIIFTILFTVAATAFFTQINAQSQRMGVIETFTGAACPPCASWNPLVKAGIEGYSGGAMYISWQVPIPSDDAMYDDNTSGVDARRNYYGGVNAAPTPFSQGQSVDDSAATTWGDVWGLHEEDIDANIAEMSEFDLTLTAEITNGAMVIGGSIAATMMASGDLSLFLLIGEKIIDNGDLSYPGTNGESEFHHVFKDYVGGAGGVDLAASWAIGDSYTIDETFDLTSLNIYDYSKLEVTALIQNNDSKYIHQAARASDLEISVEFDNTASAAGIEDVPAQCSGNITIEPVVTLSNTGNLDLTSATISYEVNGGAAQTYDWTGSLTTFASEDVALPGYTFDTDATNTLNVTITLANGGTDEFLGDNTASTDIAVSPEADSIILELTTDTYADEIYWEVQNSSGTTIASGGNPNVGLANTGTGTFPPPASAQSYANETDYSIGIDIPAVDCYTLYFVDFYGDGVSTYGGSYYVTDGGGNLLIDGTDFDGAEDINSYKGTAISISIEEETAKAGFSIVTNPVVDQLELILNINQATQTTLTVLDSQGRTVISDGLGMLGAGQYNHSYDVSGLSGGMYYVTLTTDGQVINEKVIIGQ
ncbi:MAG: hypothetical protein ACI888_000396 [Flavobacteriales bacterium]|jgi:hypothetical protein